ncbi:unnamed protein product, partial [Closterium sp. NIES-54]
MDSVSSSASGHSSPPVLPVHRLHSDRGGEFSFDLLRNFCHGKGILQLFTLQDSPQRNGIAERRIGLDMEVARTSMIHAAAPHFLWPFAVQYVAHQLNLWPCVSLPETSPIPRWTGEVGDASVFRVRGSRAFVRDMSADKLFARAIPFNFLGFSTNVLLEVLGLGVLRLGVRSEGVRGLRVLGLGVLSLGVRSLGVLSMRVLSLGVLSRRVRSLGVLSLWVLLRLELVVLEVLRLLVLVVLVPGVLELPGLVVLGALELETLRSLELQELEALALVALALEALELEELELEALAQEALELRELELLTLELVVLEALCGRDRTLFPYFS